MMVAVVLWELASGGVDHRVVWVDLWRSLFHPHTKSSTSPVQSICITDHHPCNHLLAHHLLARPVVIATTCL